MFDIGWSELLVVGLVALIVVGPKELPGMMKRIGQMIRKAKHTASSFQRQFEDAMDEGELGELKSSVKGIQEDLDPNKIMGDMVGDEAVDDFDLDKWNEQILEDEKQRTENPIRTAEEMEASKGEADTIGAIDSGMVDNAAIDDGASKGSEVATESVSEGQGIDQEMAQEKQVS